MFLLLATILSANAQHYTPGEVMAESARFREAGQSMGAILEDRQGTLGRVATGLRRWEQGLDMIGATADPPATLPPEGTGVADQALAERTFFREKAVLQTFVTALSEDLTEQFEGALQRALDAHPGEEQECAHETPVGRVLPGIRQRMQVNPDCIGEPVSSDLAALVDADAMLAAALTEIEALAWPPVTVPIQETSGGAPTLDLVALLQRVRGLDFERIDHDDRQARVAIEAALEQGKDPASLSLAARRLDAITAAARRAAAAPVIAAARAVLEKAAKKDADATVPGLCVRPADFGSCGGPDVTAEQVPALAEHKKVRKAAR